MYNFMRKQYEQEKEALKKNEKQNKVQVLARQSLTTEELQRLEEAKKSLNQKFKSSGSLPQEELDADKTNSSSYKTTYSITLRKSQLAPDVHPKPGKGSTSSAKAVALNRNASQDVDSSSGCETIEKESSNNELIVKTSQIQSVRDAIFAFEHTGGDDKQKTPPKQNVSSSRMKAFRSSLSFKSSIGDRKNSIAEVNSIPTEPVKHHEKDFKTVNLQLPGIIPISHAISPKEVVLQRRQSGEFGFTLRKGTVKVAANGKELLKNVVFAEPGDKSAACGLMPGDRLIELNGINVESYTRDEIIELIKSAGTALKLHVEPSRELIELGVRSSSTSVSSNGHGPNSDNEKRSYRSVVELKQQRSEDQGTINVEWLTAERVWLVHKEGFSAARMVKVESPELMPPDGKCCIKLEHGGEVLDVDEEDVEKANPPTFDRAEDLVTLRHLNESTILHVLRQRHASNLIHTNLGQSTLIIVNPMHPLSMYTDKVINMIKECKLEDMPPHIYSMARSIFHKLVSTHKDQSIVLMGRSGGGKTTNAKHLLTYYAVTAGSSGSPVTVEKLNACFALLDAFGNSRTVLNTNASNFVQVSLANFSSRGQLISLSFQVMLLERGRIVHRPEGEPTFSVFYQMLAGISSNLRKQLHLENLAEHCLFMTPLQRAEDHQLAVKSWCIIDNAFTTLAIAEHEKVAIYSILAAIYHLGVAGVTKGQNGSFQFAHPIHGQHAAEVLGLSVDVLLEAVFNDKPQKTKSFPAERPLDGESKSGAQIATENLERFVTDLYFEAFQAVVALLNRAFASSSPPAASILVFDCPGFRNPGSSNRNVDAMLDDLFHNYLNERLQLLYYETLVLSEKELYFQENVDCDIGMDLTSGVESRYSVVKLIEGQSLNNSAWLPAAKVSKGLLQLLDDESTDNSDSSEESFLQTLWESQLVQMNRASKSFVINHFRGMNTVQYNVAQWLRILKCTSMPRAPISQILLQSNKLNIRNVFPDDGFGGKADHLRCAVDMRRKLATNIRQRGLATQVQLQVNAIVAVLKKTRLHFVHCFLPQPDAGLSDLKLALVSPSSPFNGSCCLSDSVFSIPLVRSQLREAEILPVARLCHHGFPERVPFQEFLGRYELLIPLNEKPAENSLDLKQRISHLMEVLDCDKSSFKIGETQVFLRSGVSLLLNEKIEDRLGDWVIGLQSICRRHLALKKQQKLKLQHLAASCMQRNIRKLMAVREWSWWRLYTKVRPLLDVHRTEIELKDSKLELEQLKTKLEKMEKERVAFKQSNEILEAKLFDMAADLQEERSASQHMVEILEKEKSQRISLEKELREDRAKLLTLQQLNQKTEMELIDSKMALASADDYGDSDDEHQEKLTRVRRDADLSRKKLQQQYVEELEQLETSKRQVERRLAEAVAVNDEQNQTIQATKRRCERINQEMVDLRLHLEEQNSQNLELQKRQRKFDVELQKSTDSLRAEKLSHEKVQRERDELMAQKFVLEKEMKELRSELEIQLQTIAVSERELRDLTTSDKGDQEILKLKQLKIKLENKITEQEEELDEQAGVIQQLEQGKLKLEMSQERMRQQHLKELEERDQDLESTKASLQKKLKTVEIDLEEEHQEKQKIIQEKRNLERQIHLLSEQTNTRKGDSERNLRFALRRTKVLLKDAQLALDRQKEGSNSRSVIKQLRNQLDDAEFALNGALKAKTAAEMELSELRQQLDDMTKAKLELDQKCHQLLHSNSQLQTQCEENEEDMSEVMKKYKSSIQQNAIERMGLENHLSRLETLNLENQKLKEELKMTQSRLDSLESSSVDKEVAQRLEAKITDLQMRLDLEQTSKCRTETQMSRLKDQLEKEIEEKQNGNMNRSRSEDAGKRFERRVKELEEELNDVLRRESEANQRKMEVEKKMESIEAEFERCQTDLQLALRRIDDLHAGLQDTIECSDVDSDDDDSYDEDGNDSNLDV